jgi:hypothetical protein
VETDTGEFICDQTNDITFTIDVQDPCDMTEAEFIDMGMVKHDYCACNWLPTDEMDEYETHIEQVFIFDTSKLNFYDLLEDVPFPLCHGQDPNVFTVELLSDNTGTIIEEDVSVQSRYANKNDAKD